MFGPVRTYSDVFGYVWIRSDAFGCFRKRSDDFGKFRVFGDVFDVFEHFRTFWNVFERFRTFSDVFGRVRIHSDRFRRVGMLVAFVLYTGEANDEMCAPTAPESSEMCALKPFSCLFVALAEKTTTGFAGKYCNDTTTYDVDMYERLRTCTDNALGHVRSYNHENKLI